MAIADLTRLYATHRPLVQRGLTAGFVVYVLLAAYHGMVARPPTKNSKNAPARDGKPASARVAVSTLVIKYHVVVRLSDSALQVDALFHQRLSVILRIVIPSVRSKEALLLVMHSSLLVFRTAISLYVAALDGK